MQKHIVLTGCNKCPYNKLSLHGYFCQKADRVITEDFFESDHSDVDDIMSTGFPTWCPLENHYGLPSA